MRTKWSKQTERNKENNLIILRQKHHQISQIVDYAFALFKLSRLYCY